MRPVLRLGAVLEDGFHTCFTRLENLESDMYPSLTRGRCRACGKCIDICPSGFLMSDRPMPRRECAILLLSGSDAGAVVHCQKKS